MKNPFGKPIYLEYFGLKEAPYTTNPDERFFYPTRQHRAVMDMCGGVIERKEGLAVIIGDPGTGKTTLLNRMRSILRADDVFVTGFIHNAGNVTSKFQLIKAIAEAFNQEVIGRDYNSRINNFNEFLIQQHENNKMPILFIDEIQHMSSALLEDLRGVLNFESGQSGKLIQMILGGMPKAIRKIEKAESFSNRLTWELLRPMDLAESREMLEWRFKQAGGTKFPFSDPVINRIHSLSRGIPKTMCSLAQLSLDAAARANLEINEDLIDLASQNKILPKLHLTIK